MSIDKSYIENNRALKHRMLIVDSEEPILFGLKDYFDVLGYKVDCAHDAQESKVLLNQENYSIVIADLYLNGVKSTEGLEILTYVRQISPSTGTILLTGYGPSDIENVARRLGIHKILTQPQGLPALAQVVYALIEDLKS